WGDNMHVGTFEFPRGFHARLCNRRWSSQVRGHSEGWLSNSSLAGNVRIMIKIRKAQYHAGEEPEVNVNRIDIDPSSLSHVDEVPDEKGDHRRGKGSQRGIGQPMMDAVGTSDELNKKSKCGEQTSDSNLE